MKKKPIMPKSMKKNPMMDKKTDAKIGAMKKPDLIIAIGKVKPKKGGK